jgi:hypothetical protein
MHDELLRFLSGILEARHCAWEICRAAKEAQRAVEALCRDGTARRRDIREGLKVTRPVLGAMRDKTRKTV